jgi:dTDP-4-dehydrorhamnose reductase
MKKIWVTGSKGQLGTELFLQSSYLKNDTFFFTDIEELDLTERPSVLAFYNANLPDIIVNCAAYTNVDKAESEIEKAYLLNRDVPSLLSDLASKNNAILIHISTDYVFDGKSKIPYTEEDQTSPQSVYGKSKLEGEKAVLKSPKNIVIRTSWLYSAHGTNFVKTMLRLGKEKKELGVVSDQIGSPTYAGDLADAILHILDKLSVSGKNFSGIYHYSNEGECSWYDFAKKIMEIAGLNCLVIPITTEQYPLPAQRPAYSVFSKSKIKESFGLPIPYWKDSLAVCIRKLSY